MSDNPKNPKKAGEGQFTLQESRGKEPLNERINSSDMRRLAIRSLLEKSPVGVDDKLTMVKAAHHVDKARFQNAFRILMRNNKS